jgi:hypothetical protein
MLRLTVPLVDACITHIEAMNVHHRGEATDARHPELVLTDLIAATEVHTLNSQDVFRHLRALHLHATALHSAGHPWPFPMASLEALLRHHLAAEEQNTQTRSAALTLRARHAATRLHHVTALDSLELHHVVLLAIRAELISRRQGAAPTWLGDLKLYV